MPTLKLHHDGWLALPADVLAALGVKTGDQLLAECRDGAVVLRLAAKIARRVAPPAPVLASSSVETVSQTAFETDVPVRRKRGRPRKSAVDVVVRAPDVVVAAPWRIRRKADLEAQAPAPVPISAQREPVMAIGSGYEREERRPFRNVVIRKRGPRMKQQQT